MDQRKKNSSLWYFAGFALLVLMAVLAISAGPAFARYRSGKNGDFNFVVREPEQICFGTYSGTDFVPLSEENKPSWTEENGEATLELTVANGSSAAIYSKKDQKVSIRLIGSLGLMEGTEPAKVTLVIPQKEGSGDPIEIEGTANLITEGSEFYYAGGEGWFFTFVQGEEEYFYILEGGKLSALTFTIKVDTSVIENPAMLYPQASAEIIK